MTTLYFFNSVEFLVLALFVAAAVVAMCVRPASHGPVQTKFFVGSLSGADGGNTKPSLSFSCRDNGDVVLVRNGLDGVRESGAVNLAVTIKGFDLSIEERTVPGNAGEDVSEAVFVLDFLGNEYYHIKYTVEQSGLFATLTLHNRPGIKVVKPLSR